MTSPTALSLKDWLVSRLAATCMLDPGSIDVRERFNRYGLGSLGATRLIATLSEHLGRPLSPTLVWEHPTIEALASFLPRSGTSSTTGGSASMACHVIGRTGARRRRRGARPRRR